MRLVFRRISAFVLDMFLITFLTMAVSNLSYLNPYKYEYEETQTNYLNNYNEFISNLDELDEKELLNIMANPYHKLIKYGVFIDIYYLLFSFLYFVIFAYFNKCQTIGKKVFKLKVVGKKKKEVSLMQMILRNLIYGSNLYMGINLFLLIKIILIITIKSSEPFYYLMALLTYSQIIIELISIVLLLKNKDRSLSDLISNTKIIDLK